MNPRRQAVIHQQQRARRYTSNTDAYAFFNLLTGPERVVAAGSSGALVPADRDVVHVHGPGLECRPFLPEGGQ